MALFDFLEKQQIKSIINKINKAGFQKVNLVCEEYDKLHRENLKLYTNHNSVHDNFFVEQNSVECFQSTLRRERLEMSKGIRLVAFDISKTLIEYSSTYEQKLCAAHMISEKLNVCGYSDVSDFDIVSAIEDGIREYSLIRSKTGCESNEHEVYRKFVIPRMIKASLEDMLIDDIIRIWRENSVETKLNFGRIKEFIYDLKERNILVVTVSDMLGEMSFHALKKHQIYDLFDAHFCSSTFGVRKNNINNSLFHHVIDIMHVPAENCLMIGNDIVDDIESSRRLGFHTIYVKFENEDVDGLYDLSVNTTDDVYRCYLRNQIPGLPRIYLTPFIQRNYAKRTDSKLNQLQYQLRSYMKRQYDREFRTQIYRNYLFSYMGENTRIGNNVEVRYPDRIYVGENCEINDDVTILNEGYVIIGNNVMIARNVFISTYSHDWKVGIMQDHVASWAKGNTRTCCVSIESNSWIGPGCIFEADVFIGHHSVVAANSFVQSGVYPPYSFIAGCPAVVKKSIFNDISKVKKCYVME